MSCISNKNLHSLKNVRGLGSQRESLGAQSGSQGLTLLKLKKAILNCGKTV